MMINRIALFAASLAASLALAVGLLLAGFNPVPTPGPQLTATTAPQPQPTVQVDTVYLTPPVAPQQITVNRTVSSRGKGGEGPEGRGDD